MGAGLKEAAYGPSAAEALLTTTRGWDGTAAAVEEGGEPGTPRVAVPNGADSAGELGEPKRGAAQPGGSGPRAAACSGLVAEWRVLGRTAWGVRGHVAALFLTFVVTLAVFPGVTALICSVRNPATAQPCAPQVAAGRLFGDLWAPALFVLYNAGDVAGRAAAGAGPWAQRSPRPGMLLLYAALRILLAAPFLWCRVVTGQPWALPTLLRSDAFPVVLITLLGVTNGHLASVTAMHLPTFLPVEIRDRSGMIMTFTVTAGLTAGSILSYILVLAL